VRKGQEYGSNEKFMPNNHKALNSNPTNKKNKFFFLNGLGHAIGRDKVSTQPNCSHLWGIRATGLSRQGTGNREQRYA
jgi:hypothetical protein